MFCYILGCILNCISIRDIPPKTKKGIQMKYSLLLASLLVSTSFNVFAEEAKALSAHEEVTINAPASKVWSILLKTAKAYN